MITAERIENKISQCQDEITAHSHLSNGYPDMKYLDYLKEQLEILRLARAALKVREQAEVFCIPEVVDFIDREINRRCKDD